MPFFHITRPKSPTGAKCYGTGVRNGTANPKPEDWAEHQVSRQGLDELVSEDRLAVPGRRSQLASNRAVMKRSEYCNIIHNLRNGQ